ncbi:hypothetical protein BO99DRAFT_176622 [Aspergillus violaceofuscus CBS 115571]|uniref:Uncharacterized protein n=1 Tax=Aspergillus violaceofuscus (strain CBS 115571) TaxID=1450538 RepID=A0A2V5H1Y2_ASPV1|nr:hypothetical protein BO99DRAFT_176622 [Aspergillus violaceofuscus CBS 115571]
MPKSPPINLNPIPSPPPPGPSQKHHRTIMQSPGSRLLHPNPSKPPNHQSSSRISKLNLRISPVFQGTIGAGIQGLIDAKKPLTQVLDIPVYIGFRIWEGGRGSRLINISGTGGLVSHVLSSIGGLVY